MLTIIQFKTSETTNKCKGIKEGTVGLDVLAWGRSCSFFLFELQRVAVVKCKIDGNLTHDVRNEGRTQSNECMNCITCYELRDGHAFFLFEMQRGAGSKCKKDGYLFQEYRSKGGM